MGGTTSVFKRSAWLLYIAAASAASAQTPTMDVAASSVAVSTTPAATVVVSTASPYVIPSTWTWRNIPQNAFTAGEDLYFVITWGVLTAGYSNLSIHGIETMNGRPTYHIVSEAISAGMADAFYKVKDRNDAWLDVQSLTTVRYEKKMKEGKYRLEEVGILDQVKHQYFVHSLRVDKNKTEEFKGPLPADILDVLGSLYYVRTLPLEVGKTFTMDVYSGEKVWPLEVKVRKREKVKVPAGKFDTFLVEPMMRQPGIFVSKGKKLEVWMTADERRMPVRMRSEVVIGHVAAELVSFHKLETPQPQPQDQPPPAPPAPGAPGAP